MARVEEIPQWWWGSLWNHPGFAHGERKALTEEPDWEGPSYNEWANQGAAYQMFLKWREESAVLRQNYARDRFLPRSYFVKALLTPLENRTALLDRCALGEIKSVRQLEAEISQLKEPVPVPTPRSETGTDIDAQVQPGDQEEQGSSAPSKPELAQTPEEISKAWKTGNKLQDIDPDLSKVFDRLWHSEGSPRVLYTAIREGWSPLNRQELELFMDQPLAWRNKWEQSIANKNISLQKALIDRKLRIRLVAAIIDVLDKGSWLGGAAWVTNHKNSICAMVSDSELEDLFTLIGFEPRSQQDIDDAAFDGAAREVITRYEQGATSIADILAFRTQQSVASPQSSTQDGSTPQTPEPGKDKETASGSLRSPEELQATERIVRVLGEDWREKLSDRALISLKDLLDWSEYDDKQIERIAGLITGDLRKGLRDAIRIVRNVIDDRTPFGLIKNLCNASGGSFQFKEANFYNSIVRFDREQIESRFRQLLRGTEHYPALDKALAQHSIPDARLKVLHSMPDEELKYFISCALYGSQPDIDFSFDDSAP